MRRRFVVANRSRAVGSSDVLLATYQVHLVKCSGIGLGAFLMNIIMTVGLKGAIGIFLPAKGDPRELLPPAPAE